MHLCDSDRQEWFCDVRDHCRSCWLLLPSPEKYAAAIIRNSGRRRYSEFINGAAAESIWSCGYFVSLIYGWELRSWLPSVRVEA
ncbi:uncharacterized protein DS421_14g462240 [Arachis hypogaea]|nr:uncharacterized protein DS421_14g462240 [Arachis hypogaea]